MSRIFKIITSEGTQHFDDSGLPCAIGSGEQAGIRVSHVAPITAWLADSRGYLFLQAVEGAEPVFHNDEHVQASVWIKSGDSTRIGNAVLHWSLSGDRVEVRAYADGAQGLQPPGTPPPIRERNERIPLPRAISTINKSGRKWYGLPATILFILLAFAVLFVVTAQRVELHVQPQPETLKISGFPPVVHGGDFLLAWKGTYTLQAEKEGYQPLSEQVVVPTGANHFTFSMEKLPGLVNINSRPVSGAEVFIDDILVGKTPLHAKKVAAGVHQLRLVQERYLPLEQQLTVSGGGREQVVDAQLLASWGTVVLTTEPAGAMVLHNGQQLGLTPITVELVAGPVALGLTKKGFARTDLELDVVAGQTMTPDPILLVPAPATVHFRSVPVGATVSLNGHFAGTTPVTLSLPSGEQQEIRLQRSGYASSLLKRSFPPEGREDVTVKLKPLYGTILLTTDPVHAMLLIDGKKYGPATGRLRLTTRKHQLTVEADGFLSVRKIVVPEQDVVQRVDIHLHRKEEAIGTTSGVVPKKDGKMIALGPVTMEMGAGRREPGRRANEQERTVHLSKVFLLAVSPVTNAEYRHFKPGHRSGRVRQQTLDGDNQPVVNVRWGDAARYCNWLSAKEGLPLFYREQGQHMVTVQPLTTGYRLPTEAEWSFAARLAGRQVPAKYPWQGKFPPKEVVGNFGDEAGRALLPSIIRGYNDGFPVTAPVGSFKKNPGGFFDLGGNVSQWCHDWYTPYSGPGAQKVQQEDTMGPDRGTHHVVRGSSWRDSTITTLRLSYRGYSKVAKNDIGFRIARYVQ